MCDTQYYCPDLSIADTAIGPYHFMCVYVGCSICQGVVQGRTYCAVGSGRYLLSEEVEERGGVAVDRATGDRVEQSWEKMSKSKHNGVDPEV